ncbi:MAG: ABC transporter ATP-binding protein [Desulfuromonas sp.]|nr:MAG: ABC transporter ATP-binding protein [Desulfuromonas sp.]
MVLIEMKQLTKHFTNGADCVIALDSLDLSVEEGEFLGVMGPSGSGKSTFLALLGGLSRPTTGQLVIDGIDVYQLGQEKLADFRREYLGFIFQSHNLVPFLTAHENVMLPLTVTGRKSSEKREMAEAVLEKVGLKDRLLHLPQQLSGGEQERVAIARALVNNPPLILADEPTGSLDSRTSDQIMELLNGLHGAGQTIVMVTHNRENRRWFDRTIALKDGRIDPDHSDRRQPLAEVV